jgi:hypothetical protein
MFTPLRRIVDGPRQSCSRSGKVMQSSVPRKNSGDDLSRCVALEAGAGEASLYLLLLLRRFRDQP